MNELIELIYRFDHSVLLFIQENLRFEPVTPVMKFASLSANLGFLWIMLGILLLCFRRTRLIGAAVLSALALGLIVNNAFIKHLVDRTRPFDNYSDLIPLIKKPHDSSFASGHTVASFAAVGVMIRFFNKPIAALMIVYASLVGLSRLYLGVHYPTDVICGCLLGIAISLTVYYIYEKKFDLEPYGFKKLRAEKQ